ncbi:MAG: hypothetical protein ACQESC_02810 [Nanobdellota archaeon]
MSINKIVEYNKTDTYKNKMDEPVIYSPKKDAYVPIGVNNPKGKVQKYNIGLGPGSWY